MTAPEWMSDEEVRMATWAELLGELRRMRAAYRPGVAYMPVPRCDGCAHWNREGVDVGPYGRCLQSGRWASPDFGCVQHEAKP